MPKYVCIRTCTWAGRFFKEDTEVDVAVGVSPPPHFVLASKRTVEPVVEEATQKPIDAAAGGALVTLSEITEGVLSRGKKAKVKADAKGAPSAFLE